MIFCVSGKSSVGKDTIYKILVNSDLGLHPVTRCTTRPMRPGEQNGVGYFFTSREQFLLEKEEGKIIEYEEYNTPQGIWNYYTRFSELEGDKDLILTGALGVFNQIYSVLGNKVVPIYITLDDLTRIKRALKREEESGDKCNIIEMCRRFYQESIDYQKYDYSKILVEFENKDLDTCIEEIKKYIVDCRLKGKL